MDLNILYSQHHLSLMAAATATSDLTRIKHMAAADLFRPGARYFVPDAAVRDVLRNDKESYLGHAAQARADAACATLENARERCLCSEAAWNQMAARSEGSERARAERDAERAAAVEAASGSNDDA